MPDGRRLWRTDRGDLVEDGHKDAVHLAYGVDDDPTPEDAKLVRGGKSAKVESAHTPKLEASATPKQEAAPAKRSPRKRPAKKGAAKQIKGVVVESDTAGAGDAVDAETGEVTKPGEPLPETGD